jgi:hypothetical protein
MPFSAVAAPTKADNFHPGSPRSYDPMRAILDDEAQCGRNVESFSSQ